MIIVSKDKFDEYYLRDYEYKSFRDSYVASVLSFCGLIIFSIVYLVLMFSGKIEYYIMPFLADLIIYIFLVIGYMICWKYIRESKEQLDRYRRNKMKTSYYQEGIFGVVVRSGRNSDIRYYFNGMEIEPTGMKLAADRRYDGHKVRMYFYRYNNKPFLMVDFG